MTLSEKNNPDYLTETQTAEYLNVSRSFLRHHRQHGFLPGKQQGPKYIKIGRIIRYHIKDLAEWMRNHERGPNTQSIK